MCVCACVREKVCVRGGGGGGWVERNHPGITVMTRQGITARDFAGPFAARGIFLFGAVGAVDGCSGAGGGGGVWGELLPDGNGGGGGGRGASSTAGASLPWQSVSTPPR